MFDDLEKGICAHCRARLAFASGYFFRYQHALPESSCRLGGTRIQAAITSSANTEYTTINTAGASSQYKILCSQYSIKPPEYVDRSPYLRSHISRVVSGQLTRPHASAETKQIPARCPTRNQKIRTQCQPKAPPTNIQGSVSTTNATKQTCTIRTAFARR